MSGHAQAQNDENQSDDFHLWAPSSWDCSPPEDGPGSSPLEPFETSISDIYDEAEIRHSGSPYSGLEFDCAWVRIDGYFRLSNYWHYRGTLRPSIHDFYFRNEGFLWIEEFSGDDISRYDLHGRQVSVIGLVYDLCWQADQFQERERQEGRVYLNFGGPCHYGDLNGLMLKHAQIVSTSDSEPAYLRGEVNRQSFGDLAAFDVSSSHYREIQMRSIEWMLDQQVDEQTWLQQRDYPEDQIAEALSDDDDWSSFITDPDHSPIRGIEEPASLPFRAFLELQDQEWPDTLEYSQAYGCFCLNESCDDAWPILSADAQYPFTDNYICVELYWSEEGSWQRW